MKINSDIAYVIGVIHSDGCFYKFKDKKRKRNIMRLNLTVGRKSLLMAQKFKSLLLRNFNISVNIRKKPNKESYVIQTSVNNWWTIFQYWDKGQIPIEIQKSHKLFGVYLAGLVDGDGFIQIKNNTKDRILPQCVIKISASEPLHLIKELIELHMKCSVHYEFDKRSNCIDTCFYVSYKSIDFIRKFMYPHVTLKHKIIALDKYFKMKYEPARIRNPVAQQ